MTEIIFYEKRFNVAMNDNLSVRKGSLGCSLLPSLIMMLKNIDKPALCDFPLASISKIRVSIIISTSQ